LASRQRPIVWTRIFVLSCLAPFATGQISERWSLDATTPLVGATDEVTAATHVGQGVLLVAVHSELGTSQATRVRAHDNSPGVSWELNPLPAGARFTQAHADGVGGAYLTGIWRPLSGSAAPQVVATRVDSTGMQSWTLAWSPVGFSATQDSLRSTLDSAGNLWVAGTRGSGDSIFVRRLSPTGSVLADNEVTGIATTVLKDISPVPGGGIVTAGRRNQRAFVRAFGTAGQELWSHSYTQPSGTATSGYVDIDCDRRSGRVFACGAINDGLPGQTGLIAVFEPSGTLLFTRRVYDIIYGNNWPSTFDALTVREDGRLFALGRIGSALPQWNAFWMQVHPDGVTGFSLWQPVDPSESAYPGSRLLAGPVNQVWTLTAWGAPQQAAPTRWLLQELGLFNYAAGSFDSFPTSASGTVPSWLGMERIDEGLMLHGSLGPAADGSLDGFITTLTTSELPTGYCEATPTTQGCLPHLAYTGQLGYAGQPLWLFAGHLPNQTNAMFFYSTVGSASVPYGSGTRCVAAPMRRSPVQATGGSPAGVVDCSGAVSINFWNFVASDPGSQVSGTQFFVQAWSRDPGDSKGKLTGAVRVMVPY